MGGREKEEREERREERGEWREESGDRREEREMGRRGEKIEADDTRARTHTHAHTHADAQTCRGADIRTTRRGRGRKG